MLTKIWSDSECEVVIVSIFSSFLLLNSTNSYQHNSADKKTPINENIIKRLGH